MSLAHCEFGHQFIWFVMETIKILFWSCCWCCSPYCTAYCFKIILKLFDYDIWKNFNASLKIHLVAHPLYLKVPVIAGSLVHESTSDCRLPCTRKYQWLQAIMYTKVPVCVGSFVHESTSDWRIPCTWKYLVHRNTSDWRILCTQKYQ